jgi:hypothetical protein
MKNLHLQIYRFFAGVIYGGANLTEGLVKQMTSKRDTLWYLPARDGHSMISFRYVGSSDHKLKLLGTWWREQFGCVPYRETTSSGAIFWVWFKLPSNQIFRRSDYEAFVRGLNEAYFVLNPAAPGQVFHAFRNEDENYQPISKPFPLPLIHQQGELEDAYAKLRAAEIPADTFVNYAGNIFEKKTLRYVAMQVARTLPQEAQRLFDFDDDDRTRAFKVCRYLTNRDLKVPTIALVEEFYRKTGLDKLTDAGAFDAYWQSDVADVLDVIEKDYDPAKQYERASKYKIGMWRWLVESAVPAKEVADAGLTFPELERVLGVLTKSCASEQWQGMSKRDGILRFVEQVQLRSGLRITENKFPKIVKILVANGLICVVEESGLGKVRRYGIGEKHPLRRFSEKSEEIKKGSCIVPSVSEGNENVAGGTAGTSPCLSRQSD